MTDGTRILRTVAVPLIIALVLLILVPKTCQKALGSRKLRRAPAAAETAPTDTGLHIESSSPDAPISRPVVFPAGLDAQRVQYLVEIDPRFAEPLVLRIPKPGGPPLLDTTAADALAQAGWLQKEGGGYTVAPGGALHLEGVTEDEQTLRIPVAKRKFGRVTGVNDSGEGKARVEFTWQWDPNEAGRTVKSSFELHQGSADFAGGGEHPWDLNSVQADTAWK